MKKAVLMTALSFVFISCNSPDNGSSISPGASGASGTSAPPSPPVASPGNPGGGTQTSPVTLDSEEAAFVTLINAYRVQNGLSQLLVSITLTESSKWLSQDMATKNYFDHTDSLGRDPVPGCSHLVIPATRAPGERISPPATLTPRIRSHNGKTPRPITPTCWIQAMRPWALAGRTMPTRLTAGIGPRTLAPLWILLWSLNEPKSAIAAIEKSGAILVFPLDNRKEPASIWSHFYPRTPMRWEWDDSGDNRVGDLWHLRTELSTTRKSFTRNGSAAERLIFPKSFSLCCFVRSIP